MLGHVHWFELDSDSHLILIMFHALTSMMDIWTNNKTAIYKTSKVKIQNKMDIIYGHYLLDLRSFEKLQQKEF